METSLKPPYVEKDWNEERQNKAVLANLYSSTLPTRKSNAQRSKISKEEIKKRRKQKHKR